MPTIEYIRKIIEVESRLGFMFVPAIGQEYLPAENSKIKVHTKGIKETTQILTYNAEYNRIFGLTSWYKENRIIIDSLLDISIRNGEVYISIQQLDITKLPSVVPEKVGTLIDIANIPSGAKGNIVEDRIKELILLLGQGVLNVYKPVIDNEGIDLVILKNGQFHPIFLQVKSRYNAYDSKNLTLTISKNFKSHHSYYLIGVSFNPKTLTIDEPILMVPSKNIQDRATKLSDGKYRIVASLKANSKDQWQQYMVTKEELISILFEKFAIMEEHYK